MTLAIFRVDGLTLRAYHGVLPAERQEGQVFLLDLTVTTDVGPALRSDRIEDTVDYSALIEAATIAFTERRFNLIEAAANAIAENLLLRFPKIVEVKVTVHKPSAPVPATLANLSATVEMRRGD